MSTDNTATLGKGIRRNDSGDRQRQGDARDEATGITFDAHGRPVGDPFQGAPPAAAGPDSTRP